MIFASHCHPMAMEMYEHTVCAAARERVCVCIDLHVCACVHHTHV